MTTETVATSSTDSLSVALVAALSEFEDVPRERTADTGSYTYRYADLSDVLGYVRPILAKHGLVISQPVGKSNGELSVGTVLLHRSGDRFCSPLLVETVRGTPQQVGSTITYLRRYSLLATLGLATEDDDGAAAAKARTPSSTSTRTPRKRTARAPKTPQESLSARAFALFNELGYRERSDRLDLTSSILGHEVESWKDVSDDDRSTVVAYLEAEVSGPNDPEEGY